MGLGCLAKFLVKSRCWLVWTAGIFFGTSRAPNFFNLLWWDLADVQFGRIPVVNESEQRFEAARLPFSPFWWWGILKPYTSHHIIFLPNLAAHSCSLLSSPANKGGDRLGLSRRCRNGFPRPRSVSMSVYPSRLRQSKLQSNSCAHFISVLISSQFQY